MESSKDFWVFDVNSKRTGNKYNEEDGLLGKEWTLGRIWDEAKEVLFMGTSGG